MTIFLALMDTLKAMGAAVLGVVIIIAVIVGVILLDAIDIAEPRK